jgi:4-cresol dehydrogenase (hydroxylating)
VTRAVALSERILAEHDFDPLLVLVAHAPRTAQFLPMIAYDRDVAGDDQRAMACHDALLSALIAQGYLPERLGIQSLAALPPAVRDDARVRQRLASILDPDGVLSPAG